MLAFSWFYDLDNLKDKLIKYNATFSLYCRFGIDANGFQDAEVENIRVKLTSFISRSTLSKISLPVQFAAVNALLGTTPLSFQDICKNNLKRLPPVSSTTATDCIQRWFYLLSDEHKSLSVRLLSADAS